MAVFAGLGLGASPNYRAAGALVLGVFMGSTMWWLLLSSGVALMQSRIDAAWMQGINRISGLIILAFGVYSLMIVWRR